MTPSWRARGIHLAIRVVPAVNGLTFGWFTLRSALTLHAQLGRREWGLRGGKQFSTCFKNTGWHREPTCIIQLTIESSTRVSIWSPSHKVWQILSSGKNNRKISFYFQMDDAAKVFFPPCRARKGLNSATKSYRLNRVSRHPPMSRPS